MEYNFINWAFLVGLLGGGIPWSILFFYGKHPAMTIANWFQGTCLGIGALNIVYGLLVIFS